MGGSGGGQGSGKVEYAAYLQSSHEDLIGSAASFSITSNLIQSLNTMMASSPYALSSAFNPAADIAAMMTAVQTFDTKLGVMYADNTVQVEVNAYADMLDAELDNTIKPQYRAMMRDICAVQTSSFAIGLANIDESRQRDVAKFSADLKYKRDEMYIQGKRDVMHYTVEVKRANIQAKHDQEQRDAELDALDIGWDVECLLRGGQLLGAIGGGTHVPKGASKLQSAVTGALGGAAAGAMVGGPVGAAIGGTLGAASAFM